MSIYVKNKSVKSIIKLKSNKAILFKGFNMNVKRISYGGVYNCNVLVNFVILLKAIT